MRFSTGEISRREKKVAEPGIEQRKVHWVEVAFTLLRRACVPPKPQKLKIYLSCATFIWPRLLLEHIRSNDKDRMDNVRKNQGNLLVWQAEHLWSLQFIRLFIPKSKSCRNVSVSHTSTKLKGCWSHVNHFSFVLFFPSFLSEGNLPSPALYTSWPRGTLTTKLSAQRCKKQHGDCNF